MKCALCGLAVSIGWDEIWKMVKELKQIWNKQRYARESFSCGFSSLFYRDFWEQEMLVAGVIPKCNFLSFGCCANGRMKSTRLQCLLLFFPFPSLIQIKHFLHQNQPLRRSTSLAHERRGSRNLPRTKQRWQPRVLLQGTLFSAPFFCPG